MLITKKKPVCKDTAGMETTEQQPAQMENLENSEQASGMGYEFLSTVAHEMRTPLTTLSGCLEMLLDGELGRLTDAQREVLGMMSESIQCLKAITHNMRDVTRIAAGRIELLLQPTNLPALVETIVADLEPQLTAKAQRLTLCAPPDLPPALCDKSRVVQITANLLSNASNYTPPGGSINVSLGLAEEEDFLHLTVTDTGLPISEDQTPCGQSFRTENIRLAKAKGNDLALYATRSLVELHGGRFWFESGPDSGGIFHVTFPIAEQLTVMAHETATPTNTHTTCLKGE